MNLPWHCGPNTVPADLIKTSWTKATIKDNKITHGHTNQNIINQICNVKLLIDGTLSGV